MMKKYDIAAFEKWLLRNHRFFELYKKQVGEELLETILLLGFEYGTLRERKRWYTRLRKEKERELWK